VYKRQVGELEKAIRNRGLKFITAFAHQWNWGWYPTYDKKTDASHPVYEGL
jgi:alpha-L-fucosidase